MLPLPITASQCLASIINPMLQLLPAPLTSDAARTELIAIAIQESALAYRHQIGGPARSLWMFEYNGVLAVCRHHTAGPIVRILCSALNIRFDPGVIFANLTTNDLLGAGVARALLWSDPAAIPTDESGGLAMYQRNWRPGAFAPARWPAAWAAAQATVYPSAAQATA